MSIKLEYYLEDDEKEILDRLEKHIYPNGKSWNLEMSANVPHIREICLIHTALRIADVLMNEV